MKDGSATPPVNSLDKVADTALQRLPGALRDPARRHWPTARAVLNRVGIDATTIALAASTPLVLACSEFVAKSIEADPSLLEELLQSGDLQRAYRGGELKSRIENSVASTRDEVELKRALRVLRRREMVRIAWRDLAAAAPLSEVLATLSEFADACIDGAVQKLAAFARAQHGVPRSADGEEIGLVVLALGKLGGHELNFSSDVDLIFTYAEDGELAGRPISHGEFFLRLCQALIGVLNEPTADGFVFRVDTRLRPFGGSGPLVLPFEAMEQYYQAHGREWERYALIKARVCAGDRRAGETLLAKLKPFVYRRYLDYGALGAIREMKALIAREVERKSMAHNVKLGPGGIREIEFVAQALQLIRGGREPGLQERATVGALSALARAKYLEPVQAEQLGAAYDFLRRTEHRLQMAADEQTHALPEEPRAQSRLAAAMMYDGWESYRLALDRHRGAVQTNFAQLLGPVESAAAARDVFSAIWSDALDADRVAKGLEAAGFRDGAQVQALLAGLRGGSSYQALSADGRARLDRLMPLLLAKAAGTSDPSTTLARLVRLCESIGRRTAYFALLIENPTALTQLVKLADASPWIADWIGQHPVLLDELLDPRELYDLPNRAALEAELDAELTAVGRDNLETQTERLREFRHAHLLRVAAADIGPGLPPERIGVQLAQLADTVLSACLKICERGLSDRHGAPGATETCPNPGFAVIGYGKLGSRELGYASDLDMIFLYDGEGGTTRGPRVVPNELYFARLGQRLINLLTTRTPAGILYDVDMRLRPSGNAGPLVTSLAAFTRYQQSQAWTWEHQALVRARAVTGTARLTEAFERVRRDVLTRARDAAQLKRDVREMREKMAAAHAPAAGDFDLKHDRGGIVDIEFMVQYWMLAHAHAFPDVTEPRDNIHIMEALAGRGMIPRGWTETLADAYRRFLSVEQRLKLMEGRARVPRAELGDAPDAVAKIWNEVFAGD